MCMLRNLQQKHNKDSVRSIGYLIASRLLDFTQFPLRGNSSQTIQNDKTDPKIFPAATVFSCQRPLMPIGAWEQQSSHSEPEIWSKHGIQSATKGQRFRRGRHDQESVMHLPWQVNTLGSPAASR